MPYTKIKSTQTTGLNVKLHNLGKRHEKNVWHLGLGEESLDL